MDTHGSSVSESSAAHKASHCVDIISEGKATDKASQDGSKPISSEDYQGIENQSKIKVMPTPVVNEKYRPLFEAAQKGDWKTVEKILNKDHEAMTAEVMIAQENPSTGLRGAMTTEVVSVQEKPITVLNVAIRASQDQLVKNLINRVPPEKKDFFSNSLECAAFEGRIKMVKALGRKFDAESKSVWKALQIATTHAPKQNEVIWYLAKLTKSDPTDDNILLLVKAGHLDIALYLAHRYPSSMSPDGIRDILEYLPKMESNFRSGARLNFWEKSINKFIGIPLCLVDIPFDNSQEMKTAQAPAPKRFKISLSNYATKPAFLIQRIELMHKCSLEFANQVLTAMKANMDKSEILELLPNIVFKAASHGIFEIVKLCLEKFPELTWNKEFTEQVMKIVVKGRHVELFRLVNSSSTFPLLTDEIRKKLLETVVKESPSYQPTDVSGAPFLMQRELQWFKVLEAASNPSSKREKFQKMLPDRIGHTSKNQNWDDFVRYRKDLLQEAGQWMKDTSSSCILVATLIITVTFAGLFAPPGDYDNSGFPNFLDNGSFMIFAVADALALFSSVTASLMFLAILTSRYLPEDFLSSLPTKIILGLTFLFLSLAFMLVSFSSALTLLLNTKLEWIYVPITFLAAIPIALSAILHLPLYFEMIISTYWPRLYRPLSLWK